MPVTLSGVTLRTTTSLSQWNPIQLFSSGEQGVWYDPSDFSTMFQDSAGTTPVTAVEQPVALALDKSKSGVGTNGAKRVNLFSFSEQFDNAVWTKADVSVTTDNTTAPDGTNSADLITITATTESRIRVTTTQAVNTTYTLSVFAKAGTSSWLRLRNIALFGSGTDDTAWFNVSNGTVGTVGSKITSTSIVAAANGFYRCTITGTTPASIGFNLVDIALASANSNVSTGTNGLTMFFWGAQLEAASSASTYQRITSDWVSTIPGNHATQSTSASRPVLSARYNLLTKTEDISDGTWIKTNITTPDASTVRATTTNATHDLRSSLVTVPSYTNNKLTAFIEMAADGYSSVEFYLFSMLTSSNPQNGTYITVDLSTGSYTSSNFGTGSFVSATTSMLSDNYCRIALTGSWNDAYSSAAIWIRLKNDTGATTFAGDTTKGIKVRKADVRVSNDGVGLPSYQKVDTSTSYDTAGFPPYLRFDGVDDSLATGSINFTSTDKMTVWAGVQKSNDRAGAGMLVELSANVNSNNGTFYIAAPENANQYGVRTKGSGNAPGYNHATFTSPITNVISAALDNGGSGGTPANCVQSRFNGVVNTTGSNGVNTTAANYGSYPLYVGSRAGSSVYLFGRLYGLIVCGAAKGSGEISNTETWLNARTRAY